MRDEYDFTNAVHGMHDREKKMNFFQQQNFVISTLSPVHIGTGEDYEPGNYLIDKGYLYAFDPSVLAGKLSEQQTQQLLAIVERSPINEQALIDLQNFFKQNMVLAKEISSYKVPITSALEQFYSKRLGHVVQQEMNHRQGKQRKVANKLEIQRTCQNHHNFHYYISGSSLKGAIRTALIDQLNIKTKLSYQEQKDKKFSAKLQQEIFHYKNASDDPLKQLKVSDAVFSNSTPQELPESSIHFGVNRKRKPSKKSSMAEDKGLYQVVECISQHHFRAIKTDIRLFDKKDEKNSSLQQLGINSITKIAQICNHYYLPLLKKELKQLQLINCLPQEWANTINKLLDGELAQKLEQGKAFLLKIGKHGGADTKTLNHLRSIYIPQLKKSLDEPTTYWLAADSEKASTNMLPFGWILIEIKDSSPLVDLKNYIEKETQVIREQVKQEAENQQVEIELKLKAAEKEKQILEAEKQQQAIELEKQNLLNSLSEEQRKIKQLELLLKEKQTQDDKMAGGELSILMNELLNDSAIKQWENDLRNQLADQLEAAFNFIGWGNKKKKPGRIETIKILRQG